MALQGVLQSASRDEHSLTLMEVATMDTGEVLLNAEQGP